jgi:hypothetical protein
MTTIAIVALRTSVDEQQSTRAVRSSATAYYAAEAGLNAVQAIWNDTTNNMDSLAGALVGGDSLVLDASWQMSANGTAFSNGWHTLANGAKFQATITRLDTAGQMLYMVSVEGRDAHDLGERRLRVFVTPSPSAPPGGMWTLGSCCDAAATVRGAVRISDSDDFVDGHDELPPGWGTKDECPDLTNKTGLIMDDTDLLDLEDGWIDGDPQALAEDPSINDSTFDYFGELTWQEIKDMATIVISSVGGGQVKLDLAASYSGGACDMTDPENWGSNVPGDLCFDYYPVVLIRGEVEIKTGYGQGIVLLDLLDAVTGSEFGLRRDPGRLRHVGRGVRGRELLQRVAVQRGHSAQDPRPRHRNLELLRHPKGAGRDGGRRGRHGYKRRRRAEARLPGAGTGAGQDHHVGP